MPTILTKDSVTLSYRTEGRGRLTLLFMHGWAGSGAYFNEVIAELDLSALRVIVMDLRGHGESDKPARGYDPERLAEDAWAVADDAGAGPLVVIGFSMSAKFAQYVAAVRPDHVAGLVLVAGCPSAEIPFPPDVAREWVGAAGKRERFRELAVPFISVPIEPNVFERFLDEAVKVSATTLEETLQACIGTSIADRTGLLTMATLVVGGRLDPIFPPESLLQLARDLPRARAVFLDCNHEIPSEKPRELAGLIEAFVAGLGVGVQRR